MMDRPPEIVFVDYEDLGDGYEPRHFWLDEPDEKSIAYLRVPEMTEEKAQAALVDPVRCSLANKCALGSITRACRDNPEAILCLVYKALEKREDK